jgi:DNA-binding NtrC family response regulator
MRFGANDLIQKPWEDNRLLSIMHTQIQFGRILRRSERLEAENRALRSDDEVDFIANSPAMAPALDILERIAPSDASVLITGENGVGKGVYAKALHQRSLRADKSFVTVNMAGLPEGVFESEMFGHVKGAFTDAKSDRVGRFEMAKDGTLFLDEIANLPMSQQQKILRALETREFERVGGTRTIRSNARIITATNANLEAKVKEGHFRMDLLYRLNTVNVELPPLSKRKEDLLPLAEHFLKTYSEKYRKTLKGFSESAANALHSYAWPGNVRELMHAVERGALMAKGEFVETDNLGLSGNASRTSHDLDLMSLEEVEAYLMKRALARADGKASEAAETLGLSRSAFYRRMQRYGL